MMTVVVVHKLAVEDKEVDKPVVAHKVAVDKVVAAHTPHYMVVTVSAHKMAKGDMPALADKVQGIPDFGSPPHSVVEKEAFPD